MLASGQRTGVYVDAKLTTYRAEAMPYVGRLFLEKIEQLGLQPSAVGGLTLGADPIAMAIAREGLESGKTINAFVVRKQPKPHGMQRFIEGLSETNGVKAVIVDDVCTTGDSTIKAIEHARDAGLNVLAAICLVDRNSGAVENIAERFSIRLHKIFTLEEIQAGSESESLEFTSTAESHSRRTDR